jgi:nucleotide-binding universal stress UspA family protein
MANKKGNFAMVPEIKKILYPTDMSETSNHAFGYAASLANRYDALITIIHVIKDVVPSSENLVTNVIGNSRWQELLSRKKSEVVEKIRRRLEIYCEETKAELSSCPFLMDEVIVKIGNPIEEIIKEVDQKDYDMIIMGAHGHGAIAGAVMGSVSRRVVRRSTTPVMVVRLPDEG